MPAFNHAHLQSFHAMNDDYDQSLLKGTDLKPFANHAGIAPDIWSELPLLEQFIINDTLIKYSGAIHKITLPVTTAKTEKYRTGSMQGALLYLKQPKTIAEYLREYVILQHINHKVLFHPVLIPTILNDEHAWSTHISLLPLVIRERGWWLASQRLKWFWWPESLNKSIWDKTNNAHRYNFLNILAHHSVGQAAHLIQDSLKDENPETLENILNIIGRRPHPVYQDLLLQIVANSAGRVRETARVMSCLMPDSSLLKLLQHTPETNSNKLEELAKIDWRKIPDLEKYYKGQKTATIPPEVLMVHPYQQYTLDSPHENKRLGVGILGLKNGLSTANWLFQKYVLAHDWQSLVQYYSDLMDANEEFAFHSGTVEVLLGLDSQTFNTLWSEIKTTSEAAVWHLTFGVYSMGIMPLQENNAAKVNALFINYVKYFKDYQYFNSLKTVFVNLYLSMSPPMSDEWMRLIHQLILRATTKDSTSKQATAEEFYHGITSFRKAFKVK